MNFRLFSISAYAVVGLLGSFQLLPNSTLALAVFAVAFISFYRGLDTHIPILEITATIASLQWLVGPVIGYAIGSTDIRYEMYVEEARYFGFVLPATCVFLIGLALFPYETQQRDFLTKLSDNKLFYRGIALFIISLVAQYAYPYAPGSLAFLMKLLTQLRYVAALYFLYSGHRRRYLYTGLAMSTLLLQSAETAMFHDLIIWVSLVACYWYHTMSWNPTKKAMFFAAGFLSVFTIQVIKADYRTKVWANQDASIVAAVYDKVFVNHAFFDTQTLKAAGQRINQGWIISAIMLHVPLVEPHAEGETVKEAIISSIFPRAIMKDKAEAGGKKNFERFTGLVLEQGTSMGTSILGEAYANYAGFGGTIFMFIWGGAYAFIYRIAVTYTHKEAIFIFWLPFIFYQSIKAETELVVVLNQLTKGAIVAFVAYIGLHKFLMPEADDPSEIEDYDEDTEENTRSVSQVH